MEFGSNYQFNTHFGKSINFSRVLKNNCYFFTSGRMAISFVIERLKIDKVYLPNFLCEQVYKCFDKLDKQFYNLSDKFEYLKGLENIEDNSIVFVSNYFGLSNETAVLNLLKNEKKNKNIIVIYDITHSLYATRNSDVVDYYVASVRKWLPIPDGGLVSCNETLDVNAESTPTDMVKDFVYASVLKLLYVNSREPDDRLNQEYRKLFVKSEENLSEISDVCKISDYSENYIKNFDNSILVQRKENFDTLKSLIKNKKITLCFSVCGENDIPFSMPVLCKNRDEFRKYLMQNQVYCAIHWDQDFMPEKVKNKEHSEQILSIPIDERYSEEDMKFLAKIINKFGE